MKNMYPPMRSFFILLFSVLSWNLMYGQEIKHCGTAEYRNEMIKEHPEILQQEQVLEELIKIYSESKKYQKTEDNQVYIIPMVFHIIHQYGPENIEDAQVLDAIRILNRDYRKLNADTANIITDQFKSLAADCRIEFRLAQKDPNGNCTDGIDRIYSYRTNYADDNAKLNQWDRNKYLNIWVINDFGSKISPAGGRTLAYSTFPASVMGVTSINDGIIILNNAVGSIGTAITSEDWSRTLTHEIGHYLNLSHPWGNDNSPGAKCGDDNVQDTPYTKGWYSICPTTTQQASVCDTSIVENFQNYMDYSFCSNMFTLGQKARMEATLNSKISGRNSLWSAENLVATGVDVPYAAACSPAADFYADKSFICQGSSITFHDATSNGDIINRTWSFTGSATTSSTLKDPTVTFKNPYWQSVSLTANNSVGSDTKTKNNLVFVSPPWTDYSATFSESFEDETLFQNQWIVMNNGNNNSKWQISKSAGYSGGASLLLNAYNPAVVSTNTNPPIVTDPGVGAGDVDDIISPSFDLSYAKSMNLNFKLSYASLASTSTAVTEAFKIYYSKTCGQTWTLIYTRQGPGLVNAGWWSSFYIPNSPSLWSQESIPLPFQALKSNVRFKFEFTSGTQCNNLYIDDLNLSGTVGIEETPAENINLSIFPNPADQDPTIKYTLLKKQDVKVELYDLLGHQIRELVNEKQSQGEYSLKLNKQGLNQGIYFVKFLSDNDVLTINKLIILQ